MMLDDRLPRTAVILDEENDAEEMSVQTSFKEAALILTFNEPRANLSLAVDAEPWVRVRFGDDLYVSCGVTMIYEDDDGA